MLTNAHFKVVGVSRVITAIGTTENINPKHFLSFFVNQPFDFAQESPFDFAQGELAVFPHSSFDKLRTNGKKQQA